MTQNPTATDLEELERLRYLINRPEILDFLAGVKSEAAHQVERWGSAHDEAKNPGDWALLLDRIKGKQCEAVWNRDYDKLAHHLITMAAICANYHRALVARGLVSTKPS